MWYLFVAKDKPDTLAQRLSARAEHLARLEILNQQGRLKLAGPLPAVDSENPGEAGFVGSALVLQFDSLNQARHWADADPYVVAGVYEAVDIYPFKPVLP
jgi:uncharacterized protein YciI